MSHQNYDELIHAIYEGLIETTPWQSFLPLLLNSVDAKVVSLILRAPADNDQGLILNCLRPEDFDGSAQTIELADPDDWPSQAYKEHFFALDPFINLPTGIVTSLHELIPEQELVQSEYFRNFLQPAGVYHILGVDACSDDGTQIRLRLSRGEDEKPFSRRDKELCQSLINHLRRAIHLHAKLNRIESERNVFESVMHKLAVGTVLLDENGNVIKYNSIANDIFQSCDGLNLQDNRIVASNQTINETLQNAIQSSLALLHQQDQVGLVKALSIPRQDKANLGIVIRPVPVPAWAEAQAAPALAVFISAREFQSETSINILMELFALTRAEARLCLQLAKGLSIAEASEALFVSQHTTRAQLKSIFAKCQVTRQAELVGLIVKSVAALA